MSKALSGQDLIEKLRITHGYVTWLRPDRTTPGRLEVAGRITAEQAIPIIRGDDYVGDIRRGVVRTIRPVSLEAR